MEYAVHYDIEINELLRNNLKEIVIEAMRMLDSHMEYPYRTVVILHPITATYGCLPVLRIEVIGNKLKKESYTSSTTR